MRSEFHRLCKGCEQTESDDRKRRNRWRAKARSATTSHARRLSGRWDITSAADLVARYGWGADRMAHEAEHAYANGCGYCAASYADMGHGLADITLDIVDPDAPPYYPGNVRWCCATCNRKKHQRPPHLWAAELAVWQRWQRRQAETARTGWDPDSLFGFRGEPS